MMMTVSGVEMTTQQNNVLINLMLNGELVKVLYNVDGKVGASVYRKGSFYIILVSADGREVATENMR